MTSLLEITPWMEIVRSAVKPGQQVYLVGGAVRDLQLSVPIHDLDFAITGETIRVARFVARHLKGNFFVLDDERSTGRVITTREDGSPFLIDFTQLVDNDLETDLRRRDFTINAMGIDPAHPDQIIDPCHGLDDLHQKILHACATTSLEDDPVRSLRGIRFAVQLSLQIAPETEEQIRQIFPLLGRSSAERSRDELFKILDGHRPDLGLRMIERLGGLPYLLPELVLLKGVTQSAPHGLDVWEHTLETIQRLSWLFELSKAPRDPDPFLNDLTNSTLQTLDKFQARLQDYLAGHLVADRSNRALLILAGLYHDVGKPATRSLQEAGRIRFLGHEHVGVDLIAQRGRALVLSNAEIERLQTIIQHHMRVHQLAQTPEKISGRPIHPRAIYHFFRDTGPAGVDIALLTLADTLATYLTGPPAGVWKNELGVVSTLLEAWWEKPKQSVHPTALVDGHDLIQELGLVPGPMIGELLAAIREAQAVGEVGSQEEALAFARVWLIKNHP